MLAAGAHDDLGDDSAAVAVGLAVAVALLALYLVAIRARWFSRLPRGVFHTFLLAVGGTERGTTGVLVVWFYDPGRDMSSAASSPA